MILVFGTTKTWNLLIKYWVDEKSFRILIIMISWTNCNVSIYNIHQLCNLKRNNFYVKCWPSIIIIRELLWTAIELCINLDMCVNKMALNVMPNFFQKQICYSQLFAEGLDALNDRIKCKLIRNNTIIKLLQIKKTNNQTKNFNCVSFFI